VACALLGLVRCSWKGGLRYVKDNKNNIVTGVRECKNLRGKKKASFRGEITSMGYGERRKKCDSCVISHA